MPILKQKVQPEETDGEQKENAEEEEGEQQQQQPEDGKADASQKPDSDSGSGYPFKIEVGPAKTSRHDTHTREAQNFPKLPLSRAENE